MKENYLSFGWTFFDFVIYYYYFFCWNRNVMIQQANRHWDWKFLDSNNAFSNNRRIEEKTLCGEERSKRKGASWTSLFDWSIFCNMGVFSLIFLYSDHQLSSKFLSFLNNVHMMYKHFKVQTVWTNNWFGIKFYITFRLNILSFFIL